MRHTHTHTHTPHTYTPLLTSTVHLRSLWYALSMLNVTGQHFGNSFDGCRMHHNKSELYNPHIMSRHEAWLDHPVPGLWPVLMKIAPAARFIFTDVNSSKWWVTRTTFRGGWCAKIARPDCLVPLAFDPEDHKYVWGGGREGVRCQTPPIATICPPTAIVLFSLVSIVISVIACHCSRPKRLFASPRYNFLALNQTTMEQSNAAFDGEFGQL